MKSDTIALSVRCLYMIPSLFELLLLIIILCHALQYFLMYFYGSWHCLSHFRDVFFKLNIDVVVSGVDLTLVMIGCWQCVGIECDVLRESLGKKTCQHKNKYPRNYSVSSHWSVKSDLTSGPSFFIHTGCYQSINSRPLQTRGPASSDPSSPTTSNKGHWIRPICSETNSRRISALSLAAASNIYSPPDFTCEIISVDFRDPTHSYRSEFICSVL